jgi:hypothetical protein
MRRIASQIATFAELDLPLNDFHSHQQRNTIVAENRLKGLKTTVLNRFCSVVALVLISWMGVGSSTEQQADREKPEATGWQELASNGAWCWFADPRAVYHEGRLKRTYAGWVNSEGDIQAAAYDSKTGNIEVSTLRAGLERDDHASPAILVQPDGRLRVFYSPHTGGMMAYRVSVNPEDISSWTKETVLPVNTPGRYGYTYPNPFILKKEGNKMYLFWRGGNFQPDFATSADGYTWSEARTLIKGGQRPYVKYESDGQDSIHFAFTDGHPRNEPSNNIYYACYRKGALFRVDGTLIKPMSRLPLLPSEADKVYDAKSHNARAWIWDIALDARKSPVIVYAAFPEENRHLYRYARWNGGRWDDYEVIAAGQWFPKTPAGKKEPEPHYSGGIVLDHTDPSIVYLSRQVNGVFEIETWVTADLGRTWHSTPLTAGSTLDNVRPVAVHNRNRDHPPSVLWMQNFRYIHYTDYRAAIKMNVSPNAPR